MRPKLLFWVERKKLIHRYILQNDNHFWTGCRNIRHSFNTIRLTWLVPIGSTVILLLLLLYNCYSYVIPVVRWFSEVLTLLCKMMRKQRTCPGNEDNWFGKVTKDLVCAQGESMTMAWDFSLCWDISDFWDQLHSPLRANSTRSYSIIPELRTILVHNRTCKKKNIYILTANFSPSC